MSEHELLDRQVVFTLQLQHKNVGGISVIPHLEANLAHLCVRIHYDLIEELTEFFSPPESSERQKRRQRRRLVPQSLGVLGVDSKGGGGRPDLSAAEAGQQQQPTSSKTPGTNLPVHQVPPDHSSKDFHEVLLFLFLFNFGISYVLYPTSFWVIFLFFLIFFCLQKLCQCRARVKPT